MLYSQVILSLLVLFVSPLVRASSSLNTPVSIVVPAFSKECLFYDMHKEDDVLVVGFQVLTGGNFEIDFEIKGPDGNIIQSDTQKKYSDYLLKSFGIGQYSFCVTNSYGTAAKKVEITLGLEVDGNMSDGEEVKQEDIIANNAIEEINRNVNKIGKILNYLRAREWRNLSTVSSTESRLTYLSILTMCVMVGISVLQALIIQLLFSTRQKNYV